MTIEPRRAIAVHPGEILEENLEQNHLTQTAEPFQLAAV